MLASRYVGVTRACEGLRVSISTGETRARATAQVNKMRGGGDFGV